MTQELFGELYARWRAWANSADKSESGWESDFGEWQALLGAAENAMLVVGPDDSRLAQLADCWAASEEGEELCDFAKANVMRCLPVLRALADSPLAACRWQVYEAAASAGASGEPIVRKGLADVDAYARRRAILALARLAPADAAHLAERFMTDPDPYIRQAAIDLIVASEDADFRSRALTAMAKDPVPHVREYARNVRSVRSP